MVKRLSIWGEKPLKSALNSFLLPLLDDNRRQLITLMSEWRLIVGEEIAAYTYPRNYHKSRTDRILTLTVSPGLNTIVTHQVPELLDCIGRFLGEGKVTRIKIESGEVPYDPPIATPEPVAIPAGTPHENLESALESLARTLAARR